VQRLTDQRVFGERSAAVFARIEMGFEFPLFGGIQHAVTEARGKGEITLQVG